MKSLKLSASRKTVRTLGIAFVFLIFITLACMFFKPPSYKSFELSAAAVKQTVPSGESIYLDCTLKSKNLRSAYLAHTNPAIWYSFENGEGEIRDLGMTSNIISAQNSLKRTIEVKLHTPGEYKITLHANIGAKRTRFSPWENSYEYKTDVWVTVI